MGTRSEWNVGAFVGTTPLRLADTVRAACLDAALLAYEDAGIRGLCAEGRWETALSAIRHLDLSGVLEPPAGPDHADDSR